MGEAATLFAIDEELCTGHGRCYALAPESFVADVSGYGKAVGRDESGRAEPELKRIVGACPEEAILVQTESSR